MDASVLVHYNAIQRKGKLQEFPLLSRGYPFRQKLMCERIRLSACLLLYYCIMLGMGIASVLFYSAILVYCIIVFQ
jgi:hypothetical protein